MKKLLKFQEKMGAITKDSTNPFFKSKYFDINKLLEEVKPVLSDLGLILVQALSHIDGKPAIKTELYDVDSTEHLPLLSSTTPITENPDPQKMGSAISYFRRYAIQTMLCLQAEDDDANSSSKSNQPPASYPVKTYQLKPAAQPVEPVDKRKEKITNLCEQLGIEDKTKGGYERFVFSNASWVLKEDNYDAIIKKLQEKLEERYNNK